MEWKHAPKMGLLEYFSISSGCAFLSDLHQPGFLPLIQHALGNLPPEAYSLREWNDAVLYITGVDLSFSSPQEAAAFLRNYSPDSP